MKKIFLLALFFSPIFVFATHNRAGEITYRQIDAYTIECTIITYTQTSSIPADRDSLKIYWGDSNNEYLKRSNGVDTDNDLIPEGEPLANGYKRNIYTAQHIYNAYGDYTLSMLDPNRNAGILNVNFPNSVIIPFYIETTFNLSSQNNSSPILLEAPIDIGYLNMPFTHTPNAFDFDGDSIAYRLIEPLMDAGTPVGNYQFVDEIMPGANNTVSFDEATGFFQWDAPQLEGQYNIAIEIISYRDGQVNGRIIRDMQILILGEDNFQPEIIVDGQINNGVIQDVFVGDTVQVTIHVEDADLPQYNTVSSSCGLYDYFQNPASFTITNQNINEVDANFYWIVKQEHIRDQAYQLVFKSSDDLGLANHFILRYRVNETTNNIKHFTQEKIAIFPNPNNGIFNLNLENPNAVMIIKITNSYGRTLFQEINFKNTNQFDISKFPRGIYFLNIYFQDNTSYTHTILKK